MLCLTDVRYQNNKLKLRILFQNTSSIFHLFFFLFFMVSSWDNNRMNSFTECQLSKFIHVEFREWLNRLPGSNAPNTVNYASLLVGHHGMFGIRQKTCVHDLAVRDKYTRESDGCLTCCVTWRCFVDFTSLITCHESSSQKYFLKSMTHGNWYTFQLFISISSTMVCPLFYEACFIKNS